MSTKSKANEFSSPLHDGLEKPSSVEGWESLPLGQFAQAKGGYGFPMDRQGKKSGTYPFFKVSDMNLPANRKNMIDSNTWVDEDDLRVLKAKTFPSGAVVFPKIGATILTNKKRLLVRASVIDNNVMAVVIQDASRCGSDFLYYWFRTIDLGKLANPGTVPSITSSRIHDTPVLLPPLAEQQKIAAVLGVVQRAMEQQERLLALTAELKKALLHQLFTHGLRHEPQKETEIGPVPRSWDVRRLGDYARVVNGYAFKSDHDVKDGVRLVRIGNVGVGTMIAKDEKYLSQDFLTEKAEYALAEGDLILALTRPIIAEGIKFCFVRKSDLPALLNQRVGKFQVTSPKLLKDYLSHVLFSNYFIKPLKTMAEERDLISRTSALRVWRTF